MTWLEQLKSASLIEPLGWTILHSLWQGTSIVIIAAVILRLTRSRSAQLRYVIACLTLFSMLIAAIGTFIELRPARIPAITGSPIHLVAPTVQPMQISETVPAIHPIAPSLTDRVRPILPSLALAWIAGVLLLGAYHAGGWMLLRRLRFQSRTIADVSSRAMLTDLIAAMQIHRTVQLCESALVQVPTVIGWLSPIILLPASAVIGLSPSELRGLLAHELAHIRRHDYLVNLLQTVIETLLFYHPATWWLGNVIRQERENCCDDLAAAVCDRTIYAQALANMESLRQSPQLALSAKGAALLPRIRRILGMPTAPNRRPLSSGIVSASILVAVIAGGIVLNACRSNPKDSAHKTTQPISQPDIAYTDPTDNDLIAYNGAYRIRVGDAVTVTVNDLQAIGTETTLTKRVINDGDLSLPMIGMVHVGGYTESELNKMIAKKYEDGNFLKNAVVSVTVAEKSARRFSIRGCINQPGQYEIPTGDFRLIDALAVSRDATSPAKILFLASTS
jgi:beta-lactamase regulating signal transducer with metallopeptidase domain